LRRVRFSILVIAAAALTLVAAPAHARLLPSVVIDGPSSEVLELGGVAMADDGTGGVAYLRRDPADGRVHVYAARFDGRTWSPPQRVDVDQPGLPQQFDSSWARIGAARDGRLVVTWFHPRALDPETQARFDTVMSAVLPRGETRFLPPTVIDFNARDGRHGAFPSLAMNATGQALLSYRVVTTPGGQGSRVPTGYVVAETRVARFNGSRWSVLGERADRTDGTFVRAPTAANSPKVAIDPQGNGVIAFQEPDDERQIDRIWARRIFGGQRFGVPLLASPAQYNGQPLNGHADDIAVAAGPFGRSAVAWRQEPGPRSPLAGPRVFVNLLPETFAEGAAAFTGAKPADGAGDGAPPSPGGVSVAVGRREGFALGFSGGTSPFLALGDDGGGLRVTSLADGGVPTDPAVSLAADEHNVVAWRSAAGGGEVALQQRRGDQVLAAGSFGRGGGAVSAFDLAASGHGDAIVGLHQGSTNTGRVAARVVDAPPEPFALQLPSRWIRSKRPVVRWERAVDALGGVRYRVIAPGRTLGETDAARLRLARGALRNGVHSVRAVAIDASGQATQTEVQRLRIDRRPPRARVRRLRKGRMRLVVRDGPRGRTSGPARRGMTIRWGDGRVTQGGGKRIPHKYKRPGRYRIVATLRDRAGNKVTRRLRVRVPG
jgi:hypothetical protein